MEVKKTEKDDGTIIEELTEEQQQAVKLAEDLQKLPNCLGVSEKPKKRIKKDKKTSEEVARVWVTKKVPKAQLAKKDLIPEKVELQGKKLKTDVIDIGEVVRLDLLEAEDLAEMQESEDKRKKHRPARPGDSVCNITGTAGTPGGVVKRIGSKTNYAATNTHVACQNIVDDLSDQDRRNTQPGPYDLPSGESKEDYLWSDVAYAVIMPKGQPAFNDFALLRPYKQEDLQLKRPTGLMPTAVIQFQEDDEVEKPPGRTMGRREGVIVDTDAIIAVGYGSEGSRTHRRCIVATAISAGGESGNWVYLKGTRKLGAYLFAGSQTHTIMHDMANACYTTSCEVVLDTDEPTPGAKKIELNVTLEKGEDDEHFSLYGVVSDSEGQPIESVNIVVKQEGLEDYSSTDSDGKYFVDMIPTGKATLAKFSKEGYKTKVEDLGVIE